MARFDVISQKLSQNRVVSAEYVEKACHSPCFQNRVKKSPLEILRFPFWDAFSHKELMGHFDAYAYIIVKMTKCRQMCTRLYTRCHAKWTARYPHGHRQQAAFW